ncbi:ABC transporter substrate-binding protein [Burkholderia anthina]|uniref:ABC transporter substrate-binding protein n=1 Tax=Burkholderia anthina TaxID=179879 RepID=UPI00158C1BB4|nr:extracellular solute-binding protein [Burkholderia anthina]
MKRIFLLGISLFIFLGIDSAHAQADANESRQLDTLYRQALGEGGTLTVYAGGDTRDANLPIADAFEQRFPGIRIRILTDLSKFQDARIDHQIETGHVTADVVHLQTVQDFDRWKKEGVLLRYIPNIGWGRIPSNLKDSDGYYTGFAIYHLGIVVNTGNATSNPIPRNAQDLLDPRFRGKIVLTYPNDDDAVLFIFHQLVKQYGWHYVDALVKQNPVLRRGTLGSADDVASGKFAVTLSGSFPLTPPPGSAARNVIPADDFMTWPQTAAILKDTQHPAAAKLYLNWLLSREFQGGPLVGQWPIRVDVRPPAGYLPVWNYRNTNPAEFATFMQDRAALERFRAQLTLYFGEVKGADPTGHTGF